MEHINFFVVFLEGLLSFLSPCILPILPVYLSILSGSNVDNLKSGETGFFKSSLFKNTILFVLGISVTFFILGSSVNALSSFFNSNKDLIMLIGGILIVIMGLFYIGIIKSNLLNREKRFNMQVKEMNSLSAFLLGFTFSFGWTPCIGPILASVLIMASSSSNPIAGNLLIVVYTIGFILPFIIVAGFYSKLYKSIDKMKNYMGIIKKICGIILIVSGLVMVINGFNSVSGRTNMINNNSTTNSAEKNEDKNNSGNSNSSEDENKLKALDFTLYDQYGNEHKLSDYKGKTIFLNFWATWCPPCKAEMPHIEEIYKEYGENKDDVVILGVASPNLGREGTSEHVTNFLSKEGYTFPVLLDDYGSLVNRYGINSFPTTFIIDKDGYIQSYIPGAMSKETMEKVIGDVKK